MDEQYRKRVDERAMELIRSGEYDHLVIPERGARLGRNNQDDRGLSYSIRDIPTFDGNGDSLPHIHMLEFSDFLDNTGSEFRDLPQEPQAEDREYHMAVIKDVVSNFKISLRGKPRIWFEMQYPTSADEPKTKVAYEKMVASFLTEHNPMGNTKEQLTMAWKTLNWNPTGTVEIVGTIDTVGTVGTVEEVIEVIQTQVQNDRYRARSRDSSRSRSGSRGRTIKNCTYCHKPNHDWSHCYRYPKDIKKVCSGNLRIDDGRDKDEQARWQMLIDLKNYIESEKDSTN